MKQKLIISTIAVLISITAMAQSKHQFSVNVFSGLQSVQYNVEQNGTHSGNFGVGGGVGYTFNLNSSWGIGTGVDLSYYGASVKYNRLAETYNGYDPIENTNFIFQYSADNYEESQSALLLEIPLIARYSTPVGANSVRFSGGFKVGLPVNCKYTSSAGSLKTSGSYTYENQQYQNIPGVFGTAPLAEQSGKFELGVSFMLTLEAAYHIALSDRYGCSVGLYFNYGLNDMQSNKDKHTVAFTPTSTTPVTTNSVIDGSFVSSVRPFAVGLKLSFDLGL